MQPPPPPPPPLPGGYNPDDLEHADRNLQLENDRYANIIAAMTGLPYDHVSQILRANAEAHSTMDGSPLPLERRYFPPGSLPGGHTTRKGVPTKQMRHIAADALRTQMPSHGIPPETVAIVLDELAKTDQAVTTWKWTKRALIAVVPGFLLLALGLGIYDDLARSPDPDPDGAWSAPIVDAVGPLADRLDGPEDIWCLDDERDNVRRVQIRAELSDEVTYRTLADALESVGLPNDPEGRFTFHATDESFDDGVVVSFDRDEDADRPATLRITSPCGATSDG